MIVDRPDADGAEGGTARADRRGLHLVQDLHDLRRHEAGRPPDPAPARGRAPARRAGDGACRERRLHRLAHRGARSRRPDRAEVPRRVAADGGGARGHAPRDRAVRAGRRADPDRARVRPRGDRADPLGPCARPAHLRRDLPAVPVPDGRDLDEGYEGAKCVCSPPPRDKANQRVVWDGLADGLFTIFSSDHAPFRFDDPQGKKPGGKEVPFPLHPERHPGPRDAAAAAVLRGRAQRRASR